MLFKDISKLALASILFSGAESIFNFGGHFVQRSGTVCAILVEGIVRNISVKLFEFGPGFRRRCILRKSLHMRNDAQLTKTDHKK